MQAHWLFEPFGRPSHCPIRHIGTLRIFAFLVLVCIGPFPALSLHADDFPVSAELHAGGMLQVAWNTDTQSFYYAQSLNLDTPSAWETRAILLGNGTPAVFNPDHAPHNQWIRARKFDLATSSVDFDTDGMPDGWELRHALDPMDDGQNLPVNGYDGDLDEDGIPNGEEFQRQTDPGDDQSGPASLYVNGDTGSDLFDGLAPAPDGARGPKATLDAAVYAAYSGDEIHIHPGTYTEPALTRNLSLTLVPSGTVTILPE